MEQPVSIVAKGFRLDEKVVSGIKKLLDEGYGIPYISAYRRDVSGGLDEILIAALRDGIGYFSELEERKREILAALEQKSELTDSLRENIAKCGNRAELEDLYFPYKSKKRTKVEIARKLGLEPLAQRIWAQADDQEDVENICRSYLKPGDEHGEAEILESALAIVAEYIIQSPEVRHDVRDITWREGELYYKRNPKSNRPIPMQSVPEPVSNVSHHRFMELWRSEAREQIILHIKVDENEILKVLDQAVLKNEKSIWRAHLVTTIRDAYERILAGQIEREIVQELKRRADEKAIALIDSNLQTLLLKPPLPGRVVLALSHNSADELQTVVIDQLGRLLEHQTMITPVTVEGKQSLIKFVEDEIGMHNVEAVAVDDSEAGLEIEKLLKMNLENRGLARITVECVKSDVAAILADSDLAREEYPKLYPQARRAISLARRLQDPLAEIAKVDIERLELGQYQKEVDQNLLNQKLKEAVYFSVNRIGVDANSASWPLMACICGLDAAKARAIVEYRRNEGPILTRAQLTQIPGIDEKIFEQSAPFIRVAGDEPLDATPVHPKHYELARRIAADLKKPLTELFGKNNILNAEEIARYIGGDICENDVKGVLRALSKAGHDPRFDVARAKVGREREKSQERKKERQQQPDRPKPVEIEVGMELEGTIRNITEFGVFVDIGGRREGMIHVSELDHRFVKDPNEIVKSGEKVRVKVIEIDDDKKRIKLSRKALLEAPPPVERSPREQEREREQQPRDRERRDSQPPRDFNGNRGSRNQKPVEYKDSGASIGKGRLADLLSGFMEKDKSSK